MCSPAPCENTRNSSAFSLVEVALAIGITVSVLTTTLALLGIAMNGARQAGNQTLGAGIAAQLIGEYQLAGWSSVTSGNERLRYFDDFGEELQGSEASGLAAATARAIVSHDGPTLTNAGSPPPNPHLRKVVVVVATRSGPTGADLIEEFLSGNATGSDLQVYRSFAVNQEK